MNPIFDRKFKVLTIVFFGLIILIFGLPILFTSRSTLGIDFSTTGQIGDTIGGITTPFITIIVGYFTFLAFWVQYKWNIDQNEKHEALRFKQLEFDYQNEVDSTISSIENATLELMQEYKIQSKRVLFRYLINEFKSNDYIYKLALKDMELKKINTFKIEIAPTLAMNRFQNFNKPLPNLLTIEVQQDINQQFTRIKTKIIGQRVENNKMEHEQSLIKATINGLSLNLLPDYDSGPRKFTLFRYIYYVDKYFNLICFKPSEVENSNLPIDKDLFMHFCLEELTLLKANFFYSDTSNTLVRTKILDVLNSFDLLE